jgi:glycopeptide antibiotics resistance protein
MLPLRYQRLWRFLSVLLLLVVLAGTLTPSVWFDSKVEALIWFENVDKWIHGLSFLFLSIWFAGLWGRSAYWHIAAGLMVFGFLVEGCQLLVSYRTADWLDIAANTVGIMVGLVAATAGLGGWGPRLEARYSRARRR